jgi:hypothetical protein
MAVRRARDVRQAGGEDTMAKAVCRLKFEPEKGRATLIVERDTLFMEEQQDFRDGCRRLLESGQGRLFVDLSSLRSLLSIYLDIVLDANRQARGAGRSFTVVVGRKLGELFRTVVGPEVLSISPVDSG